MARATRKARGGQRKPSAQRKSRSVTIRVLEGFKQRIEAEAAKSGRSVSEEIAYRVGLSYLIREPVETAAEVARILAQETDETIEAAMERRRWDKINDTRKGVVWAKPGQMRLPWGKSGFIDPNEPSVFDAKESRREDAPVVTKPVAEPVVTMSKEELTQTVKNAVVEALSKAKLTIPGDEK